MQPAGVLPVDAVVVVVVVAVVAAMGVVVVIVAAAVAARVEIGWVGLNKNRSSDRDSLVDNRRQTYFRKPFSKVDALPKGRKGHRKKPNKMTGHRQCT